MGKLKTSIPGQSPFKIKIHLSWKICVNLVTIQKNHVTVIQVHNYTFRTAKCLCCYMKKKEKYYPLNCQEDEDGYTHYPGNTGVSENAKDQEGTMLANNIENTEPDPAQLQSNNFSSSATTANS
jgi:hypothetical protein